MISRATSVQFREQISGTFNRPILALCRESGSLHTYYLKYQRNSNEFDGLVSEIICSELAQRLNLNTPEISLVTIGNHTIDPDKIDFHDRLHQGQIIFGSKGVKNAEELSRLNFVLSKHDFNRLEFPPHILRIGLFDMWIGNKDRTEENYNLLISTGKKQKLYVFDHFEAFAKITENSQTEFSLNVDVWHGLLGSSFGYELLGWVTRDDLKRESDGFFDHINSIDVEAILEDIVEDLPRNWEVRDETIGYISRFLSSEDRMRLIQSEMHDYLEHLPQK